VATLSLALDIGANTAIFQLLNAVHLRRLPVTAPHELAEVLISTPTGRTGTKVGRHFELTTSNETVGLDCPSPASHNRRGRGS
jgi:hypothetical protein